MSIDRLLDAYASLSLFNIRLPTILSCLKISLEFERNFYCKNRSWLYNMSMLMGFACGGQILISLLLGKTPPLLQSDDFLACIIAIPFILGKMPNIVKSKISRAAYVFWLASKSSAAVTLASQLPSDLSFAGKFVINMTNWCGGTIFLMIISQMNSTIQKSLASSINAVVLSSFLAAIMLHVFSGEEAILSVFLMQYTISYMNIPNASRKNQVAKINKLK